MPGSEKVQLARQSSQIQGGQDTIERQGGLDGALRKISQPEQETPAFDGRRMIDDFRLWGPLGVKDVASYGWNGYSLTMFTQPFHVFDSPNAFLSEGGALAVVVAAALLSYQFGEKIPTKVRHAHCILF